MIAEGQTYTTNDTLTVMHCCECGILYAVPERFRRACKQNGKSWHCPNGHVRIYRETESQRLEKELAVVRNRANNLAERVNQVNAQKAAVERQLTATKGVVTRTKRRIGNGVCPCCKRSFKELRAHMKSRHPDYAADKT